MSGKRLLTVILLTCLCPFILDAETVKVGVVAPLTGGRAEAGQYMRGAIEIAEHRINSDSARKYKLNFLIEDSRYEPLTSVTVFKKLTEVEHVSFVIGPSASTEALALLPLVESANVLMLTPSAQAAEITKKGGNIFRIIHNTSQEAPLFAAYIAKKMKGDSLVTLMLNTIAAPSYVNFFRPAFEAQGKKVAEVEIYEPKETDFRSYLTKFRARDAKDVLLLSTPSQVALITSQAHQVGLKAQFYNLAIEGPEMTGPGSEYVEGLIYPYSYDSGGSAPEVRQFYEEYVRRFGGEPDTIAANTYDAAVLLSNCLEKSGADVPHVKECLYSTHGFDGAGGTFDIDDSGNAVKKLFVKTVRGGKFVRIDDL